MKEMRAYSIFDFRGNKVIIGCDRVEIIKEIEDVLDSYLSEAPKSSNRSEPTPNTHDMMMKVLVTGERGKYKGYIIPIRVTLPYWLWKIWKNRHVILRFNPKTGELNIYRIDGQNANIKTDTISTSIAREFFHKEKTRRFRDKSDFFTFGFDVKTNRFTDMHLDLQKFAEMI